MAENKIYNIGDYSYSYNPETKKLEVIAYIGATGPGSVATIPEKVEIPDEKESFDTPYRTPLEALENLDIEKVVVEGSSLVRIKNLPKLKELEVHNSGGDIYSLEIQNTPYINRVILNSKLSSEIEIADNLQPVTIEYKKGWSKLDKELPSSGFLHIFGDEAENVGVIRGGHIVLGKGVKNVTALKKAEFGISADTTIAEYELPTRIDFLSSEPPVIGSVAPGSISVAEIHVPPGALEAYMQHPQWGKAAYFVEEGGKTVDNYFSKHKARLKKLQKERQEEEAKNAEKAKQEKVKAIGGMAHKTLGEQRLSKWTIVNIDESYSSSIYFQVKIGCLGVKVSVPKDAPVNIWDNIEKRLETIEAELK